MVRTYAHKVCSNIPDPFFLHNLATQSLHGRQVDSSPVDSSPEPRAALSARGPQPCKNSDPGAPDARRRTEVVRRKIMKSVGCTTSRRCASGATKAQTVPSHRAIARRLMQRAKQSGCRKQRTVVLPVPGRNPGLARNERENFASLCVDATKAGAAHNAPGFQVQQQVVDRCAERHLAAAN